METRKEKKDYIGGVIDMMEKNGLPESQIITYLKGKYNDAMDIIRKLLEREVGKVIKSKEK
jgi:hypothetical protein